MDNERTEDLNPRNDDIEEKVRRMLDPNIPDAPEPTVGPAQSSPSVSGKSISVEVQDDSSSFPDLPAATPLATEDSLPSAPELPVAKKKLSSKSKKIIAPLQKFEANAAKAKPKPDAIQNSDSAEGKSAVPNDREVKAESDALQTENLVKQITIIEHDESPAEVAEKLSAAIAELSPRPETTSPFDQPSSSKTASGSVRRTAGTPPSPKTVLAQKTSGQLDEFTSGRDPSPDSSDDTFEAQPDAEPSSVELVNNGITDKKKIPKSEPPAIDVPIVPVIDDTVLSESPIIADPAIDKAVEDIVAKESDELLEIEDAMRDTDEPVKPVKSSRPGMGAILKGLWSKPALRLVIILLILFSFLTASAVPGTRYFLLNTAGIQASSSLRVLDNSTQQPLKNVAVTIGNSTGTTDEEGNVFLHGVKLGKTTLTIQKRAFAPITKDIIIGWGSNQLGGFDLTPTGTQYSFVVTDFLSGKPVSKVEASSGEASSLSDEKGAIKLTIDKVADQKFTVFLKSDKYRTEQVSIDPNDTSSHALKLVPGRKQVFVSKRSGKFDIYSVYIDGKDEKLVLAGLGNEKDGMVLVPHPTNDSVAYVSTRTGQRNSEGFLLSKLILINTTDNTTTDIGSSERIQLIEWAGDRLVYVQIAAGTSANSPKRYRLISYNHKDDTSKELASSNFFNDVIATNGAIYYAPSSAYQAGPPGLYKINADGSGAQTIFNQEVWNIFRTTYDRSALSVQQQWYDYRFGDKAPVKLNSAPANQTPRVYIDSPDGRRSLWIDKRDGKGTLLSYDTDTKVDTTLLSQSGVNYPVHWLNNDTVVYRVKTDQETADYALSMNGGKPVKIKDVTGSGGLDRWYYY